MSENDKPKPYHARDVSSGQEAADAVRAVMEHAHERDEAAKKKTAPKAPPKWLLPLGINLGVLATYLLVAQPDWAEISPIAELPPEEQVSLLANDMWFVINKIESYRLAQGEPPTSIDQIDGIDPSSYTYVRTGADYVLIPVGQEDLRYATTEWESPHAWSASINVDVARRIGG